MKQQTGLYWRRTERWDTKHPGEEGEHIYVVYKLSPQAKLGNRRAELIEDGSRWLFQAWNVFQTGDDRIFIEMHFEDLEIAKTSAIMQVLLEGST